MRGGSAVAGGVAIVVLSLLMKNAVSNRWLSVSNFSTPCAIATAVRIDGRFWPASIRLTIAVLVLDARASSPWVIANMVSTMRIRLMSTTTVSMYAYAVVNARKRCCDSRGHAFAMCGYHRQGVTFAVDSSKMVSSMDLGLLMGARRPQST